MAGMIETPVVVVNVQRGGPSTGIADQDRAGRSEPGHRGVARRLPPRIVAPRDATDCFYTAVEAFNLAKVPASRHHHLDLLLGEHRSTVDPEAISSQVRSSAAVGGDPHPDDAQNGGYKRYALRLGISPPPVPAGGLIHVSARDDHDRARHTDQRRAHQPAIRRKIARESGCADGGRASPPPAPVLEGEPEPT